MPKGVYVRTEQNTGDMPIRALPPIILSGETERENIAQVESGPLHKDYYDALAFGEEMVKIRIERSSDKDSAQLLDFYVNGIVHWVPVGIPHVLARKYVEVIARAQPYTISADYEERHGQNPVQTTIRTATRLHSMSIIKDTDRGHEWLTRVMMES